MKFMRQAVGQKDALKYVRAVDSVTALAIDRQDFQSLFASIPALRQSVDSAVQSRA